MRANNAGESKLGRHAQSTEPARDDQRRPLTVRQQRVVRDPFHPQQSPRGRRRGQPLLTCRPGHPGSGARLGLRGAGGPLPLPAMAESRTAVVEFAGQVNDREATVAIVGLGYVGLPLAMAFAASGLRTIGLDVDAARVDALPSRIEPHRRRPRRAARPAAEHVRGDDRPGHAPQGRCDLPLRPHTVRRRPSPDLDFVRAPRRPPWAHGSARHLVVLQSTTYPGTTKELVQPIVEDASGLGPGPTSTSRTRPNASTLPTPLGRSRTPTRSAVASRPSAAR